MSVSVPGGHGRVGGRPGDRVAQPLAGLGEPGPARCDERPRVVGVDRQVRVPAGRRLDLADETVEGQLERRRQGQPEERPGRGRGRQAERAVHEVGGILHGVIFNHHHSPECGGDDQPDDDEPGDRQDRGDVADGDGRRHEAEGADDAPDGLAADARIPPLQGVDEIASQENGEEDRDEDAELRLDDGRDDGVRGRPLGPVAPQLPQAEQEEDEADGVDLAPDDAVEPGDRDEEVEGRPDERGPAPAAELEDHRPDEPADREIGQHRGDLDELESRQEMLERADEPQQVQVARRVVVEEVPLVEAPRAVRREVVRPEPEGVEVHAESGARQDVCDDEPEGEPEREKDQDRAGRVPRAGGPHRGCAAPIGLTRGGASQRGYGLLHER